MKKKHATKMRFIVLKVIPIGIIPDTQTRLSGGCSGIALFSLTAHLLGTTQDRGLQLVGTSCTFGESFSAWVYLLLN